MKKDNSKREFSKKALEFYERLERIEGKYGLSKENLAEVIGISVKSFYNSRNVGRGLRMSSLFQLHEKFEEINFNWLLFGEGTMEIATTENVVREGEATYDSQEASTNLSRIEEKVDQVLEIVKIKPN